MPPLLGITYGFSKALPKIKGDAPMVSMETPKHMGQKLQDEAVRLGLKPAQIAKVFGVKPPSVYDWYKHGRIDKAHYQNLVDWSGRSIEWWLDLREKAPESTRWTDRAKLLAHLFDSLPACDITRNRAFMDCCEVIKAASTTPSTDPPAPVPNLFATLGKSPA